jgi:PAB-dependent poly(A)-specific ribonuclease subunit 3
MRRFGYPSWIYKADSSKFGKKYALRRLESTSFITLLTKTINSQTKIRSPTFKNGNVSNLPAWCPSKKLSPPKPLKMTVLPSPKANVAIVFVYDYHADSKSLAQIHFSNEAPFGKQHRSSQGYHHHSATVIPEKIIWGYIIQIATGLKTIHSQGLACRVIDLSTLLVTSDRRVRLNCCGIMDVIAPMSDARIPGEQLGDLANFGRYMLCVAANSQEALHDPGRWLEVVKRRYQGSLPGALSYLVNLEQNTTRNINEFLANISDVLVTYVDASLQYIPCFI